MNKHNTFREILKLLDKGSIKKFISKHESDKHNKGFTTWKHLVTMIFSKLSDCRSLRDLEIRFNTNKKIQLSLKSGMLRRSTLSDANRNRSSDVFRDIANELIMNERKELKEVVSLIDSSIIRVDSRGSEWTKATETRCGKGLKLHIQCGGNNRAIERVSITPTNVNDITEAKQFDLESEKIYVFDKGYLDFNWWHKIDEVGSYFVTRIKKNTSYRVVKELDIQGSSEAIVNDKVIELVNKTPRGGKKNLLACKELRLVEVYDKERKKTYLFISNLLHASSDEISMHYKQRWGIELLFKWLKQNLKLTKFLGENENAIKIQIYIAIIVYLLISRLKEMYKGIFTRNIDLLSWVKVAIFSNSALLRPPMKKQNINNKNQFCLAVD
jgi:hypothetical protein